MKTSGHERDTTTSPAGAFGGGASSCPVNRQQLAMANAMPSFLDTGGMAVSTPVSMRKRTPIVCASYLERAREQVEHGKVRVGSGASAGLLIPWRLS